MANLCAHPSIIRDPRKGHINEYLRVPCGKCALCLENRQKDWFVRLKAESLERPFVRFVTLTYDDLHIKASYMNAETGQVWSNLPNLPIVASSDFIKFYDTCYLDAQKFHKRARKKNDYIYMGCTEYGSELGRPHFHFIIFSKKPLTNLLDFWTETEEEAKKFNHDEPLIYGERSTDLPAEDGSFYYITKYVLKATKTPQFCSEPRNYCSKGLGKSLLYYKKYYNDWLESFYNEKSKYDGVRYASVNGIKYSIPRYYRKKIIGDMDFMNMRSDLKAGLITSEDTHCYSTNLLLERVYQDLRFDGSFEKYISDYRKKHNIKYIDDWQILNDICCQKEKQQKLKKDNL